MDEGRTQSVRKVALASFIGTTIEWYDFFLYGTAAALVFNELFFPEAEPLIGTLLAFSTYAVGFAARPIGGVVFGHYGDRIGRKSMLVLSLLIMGVATFLIGCLPTHASIGVLAPILLVVLRFAQGIGVGGEWGGAVLMSVEHAPKGRRGFYGAWPQMGVPAGLLISTSVFAIVQGLTNEAAFLSWGWRVPFLASAVLVIVGLFIRLSSWSRPPSSASRRPRPRPRSRSSTSSASTRARCWWRWACGSPRTAPSTSSPCSCSRTGRTSWGCSKNTMLTGVIIAAAIGLVTVPLFGHLSDRVGRRPLYLAGAVVTTLWAFPLFGLLNTESPVLIWLAIVVGVNLGHDLMYGPQAAFFAELFGTRVRYSGASLGYQLASVFAGGLAPLIATALLAAGDGSPTLVALYVTAMGLISVVATLFASETFRKDVDEDEAEERELVRERRFDRERVRETAGQA